MDAAISNTQGAFSQFSAALLRDTGYYSKIVDSFVEPLTFGKGNGCSFVTGACDPKVSKEFCVNG